MYRLRVSDVNYFKPVTCVTVCDVVNLYTIFELKFFWSGIMEKAVVFRQLVDTLSINEFETFISELINKNGVEWIKSALYNQFISDSNLRRGSFQSHDHHHNANKTDENVVDNAIQIIQNITNNEHYHFRSTPSSINNLNPSLISEITSFISNHHNIHNVKQLTSSPSTSSSSSSPSHSSSCSSLVSISAESFVHSIDNDNNSNQHKSAQKLKIIFKNKSNNIMDLKNQIEYIFGDKWCWMSTTELIIEWNGIYCNELQNHLLEILSKSTFIPKLTRLKSITLNGWTNIEYQYKIVDKLLSLLPDAAYIKLDDEYVFNHYRQSTLSSINESDINTNVSIYDTNNWNEDCYEWYHKLNEVSLFMDKTVSSVRDRIWEKFDKYNQQKLNSNKYLPRLLYTFIVLFIKSKCRKSIPPKYNQLCPLMKYLGHDIVSMLPLSQNEYITKEYFCNNITMYFKKVNKYSMND